MVPLDDEDVVDLEDPKPGVGLAKAKAERAERMRVVPKICILKKRWMIGEKKESLKNRLNRRPRRKRVTGSSG